jgi:hypothetical protein
VSKSEIREYAKLHGLQVFFTSARLNIHVHDTFECIARGLVEEWRTKTRRVVASLRGSINVGSGTSTTASASASSCCGRS